MNQDSPPDAAGVPSAPDSPRRVVVTSPRKHARRSSARSAIERDINEQTRLGEIYIRSLMRAQLRLAVTTGAVFVSLLGGLPLLFATLPSIRDTRVFGMPLVWLLLGVLVYPLLVLGGWFYVRQAERNEREFARLVDRS